MHKQSTLHTNQQGVSADINRLQRYAQETFDYLVADAISDGQAYAGFSLAKTGTAEVTADPGRMYKAGKIYTRETPAVIDVFSQLPVSTKKYMALVVSGADVETDNQPRKFLMDAETRATQTSTVPTTEHRAATVSTVAGTESANPQKPTVSSDLVTLGWALLDPAGVVSVEQNDAAELDSVLDNAQRLAVLEAWRLEIGARIDTLASDLTKLNAATDDLADTEILLDLARDVARLKELAELPDTYAAYGADRFLTDEESDTQNVNYLAKIEEGLRFAHEAEDLGQLELFNSVEPLAVNSNGFVLPAYSEVLRLAVEGNPPGFGQNNPAESLQINQYTSQQTIFKKSTRSPKRVRNGLQYSMVSNKSYWETGEYDAAQQILAMTGEEFDDVPEIKYRSKVKRTRQKHFYYDKSDDVYWRRKTVTHAVNGSVVAQTWLNAQDMWLTRLELPLADVGPSGNLHVVVCKAVDGKPSVEDAIAVVTVDHADLKTYPEWTEVPMPSVFLEAGQRYAMVLVSEGAHYIRLTQGASFAEGTLFYSTDGSFYQGDLSKDISFRLYAAKFDHPRVEVKLDPLSLSGGITDIDILARATVPEGTDLRFEVLPSGGSWTPLAPVLEGNTVYHNLPPLLEFRAVFIGTTDVMPGIDLTNSEVRISRPRTTFTHISKSITPAAATQSIKVTVVAANFYEANHDLTCVIDDNTNGATDIAPATTSDVDRGAVDDADHRRIERTFEWTATELPSATSDFQIKINGATTSALDTFIVEERVHLTF